MTYMALARKWRPRQFSEVMGQSHVVQALSNALDSGRVHHAFLFTGTRGVGKTTLARIFAKSLNCEKGMSATPCLECSVCTSVEQGNYVDLMEVDAASRTGIDDMRELLENVQYAPTSGSYKVYLIDEIHMLSKSSFNALLKTLEEPPEHVKFLFATTDPQKLPVTVLSRCLQFNLKALQPNQIREQLEKILNAEGIEFETGGLDLLARAADGSMRDSLSLLEQAIAQGAGKVAEEAVRSMLGTVKSQHVDQLLEALIAGDADQGLATVHEMSVYAADFASALDQLLLHLHHVSLAQLAPAALEHKVTDVSKFQAYADSLSAEDVQLLYQIGLLSKRDLALAPDYRSGFEMALLRMLAFKPADSTTQTISKPVAAEPATPSASQPAAQTSTTQDVPAQAPVTTKPAAQEIPSVAPPAAQSEPSAPNKPSASNKPSALNEPLAPTKPSTPEPVVTPTAPPPTNVAEPQQPQHQQMQQQPAPPPPEPPRFDEPPAHIHEPDVMQGAAAPSNDYNSPQAAPVDMPAPAEPQTISVPPASANEWAGIVERLNLNGLVKELAMQMCCDDINADPMLLKLDPDFQYLHNKPREESILNEIRKACGADRNIKLSFEKSVSESPAERLKRLQQEHMEATRDGLVNDPGVQRLMDTFDLTMNEASIKPRGQ